VSLDYLNVADFSHYRLSFSSISYLFWHYWEGYCFFQFRINCFSLTYYFNFFRFSKHPRKLILTSDHFCRLIVENLMNCHASFNLLSLSWVEKFHWLNLKHLHKSCFTGVRWKLRPQTILHEFKRLLESHHFYYVKRWATS
jgi:hypothetical protein